MASPQDAFGERKSVVTVILRRLMLCRTDVLGTLGEDVQEAFPQHRLEIATRTYGSGQEVFHGTVVLFSHRGLLVLSPVLIRISR